MFTREVFERSRNVYEQVLDKKNEEIERLTITQVKLGKTIDGLNAEIERLREHHKLAVDNWTLEAQTVKQQEDEIHELKAEVDRLRGEWLAAIGNAIENAAEIERLRVLQVNSDTIINGMRDEIERLRKDRELVQHVYNAKLFDKDDEIERLRDEQRQMVEKAADGKLEGYREMASQLADKDAEIEQLREALREGVEMFSDTPWGGVFWLSRARKLLGGQDE